MNQEKRFWSRRIRNAVPYVAGEQPKDRRFIKLNTNENPYPPSPKVTEAIVRAAGESLRLYPDPDCTVLREAASKVFELPVDYIFCGNGSDEILAFAFQAFFDHEEKGGIGGMPSPVLFPDITYSFYEVYADYFQIPFGRAALRDDFTVRLEDYCGSNGGVVLPNPNAPTGIALGREQIRSMIEHNPKKVVIIDEAYVDFGAESVVPLVKEYPNLLVVHTLSKSRSLAGLRVGLAFGQPELIAGLCCVRDSINSYTVDRLAQAGGAAALLDREWFEETRKKIMATRDKTAQSLRELGFLVTPSQSNFLFACCPGMEGKEIFDALRERGILVRRWDRPGISQYLRISVGTNEDMEALVQALKEIIKK